MKKYLFTIFIAVLAISGFYIGFNLFNKNSAIGAYKFNPFTNKLDYYESASSSISSASFSATSPLQIATTSTTVNYSITQSSSTTDGYLSSINWNTFNQKADASSVTGKTTFYHWNQTSGISGYEMFRTVPNGGTEIAEATTTIASSYVLIDSYISSSTALSTMGGITITSIDSGAWNFHTWASVSAAGGTNVLVYNMYKRATTGVETFLFQATSTALTTSPVEAQYSYTAPAFTFSSDGSDRLVAKVYAYSSASGRTITFYYDGNSRYSHVETPITLIARGYVRYFDNTTFTGNNTFSGLTTITSASTTNLTVASNAYMPGSGIWNSSGNVGIGITNPLVKTNIVNNSGDNVALYLSSPINAAGASSSLEFKYGSGSSLTDGRIARIMGYTQSGGGGDILFDTAAGGTSPYITKMIIQKGGNVGIGTTSPAQKLDVWGNTQLVSSGVAPNSVRINNSDVNKSLYIKAQNNGFQTILADENMYLTTTAGNIQFVPSSNVIISSGNVGIGTTSPESKLDIWGTASGKILTLFSNARIKFLELTNAGVATLLGIWDFSGATVKQHTYPSFTWPGTATTTTATTTVPLGQAMVSELWSTVNCRTTRIGATTTYEFYDGTNKMDFLTATSTASQFSLSTNNNFVVGETRSINIGALSNAQLTCSVDKIVNN